MQIEMTTRPGGQLVDSPEVHWWSQTGLYKSHAEYKEDLRRYKQSLKLTWEHSGVVEAGWSGSIASETPGGPSVDPA